MKSLLFAGIFLILTGCSLGTSQQVEMAEQLLTQFECNNIDNEQLTHNPITGFHQRSLAISKEKAASYIESFKEGDSPSEMPLEEMVEQEYVTFKSACQFLGGVTRELQNPAQQHQS
ncbi:hypothetical protein [Acinetobacter lanii]|uniref:Lipoprotein n=1 Tax=Acinetobacter lanii TaxID=2715163 RepID=A0A6G8S2E7_9GAMM|nr:hypothetical protein [Acinetobacter lanii]QIO08270.1 hypothetical protein G8D99_04030 [Acinetobacter lanii]